MPCAPGFSIVEAVFSIVVVGGLVMAALNTIGASQARQFKSATAAQGNLLAQELMAEILQQPYTDPNEYSAALGLESAEMVSTSDRAAFDDIDDYANHSESTPRRKDGAAVNVASGWSRSVAVEYVDRSNLSMVVTSSRGVKRIRVTASFRNVPMATVTAYRTEAWQVNIP